MRIFHLKNHKNKLNISCHLVFLVLFCQLNFTFLCSRVLLFPCSPLRTMVKNVVKTRTSIKHKWSPKNRSKKQVCGSSRKQKTGREETQCGQPESGRPKDVVRNNRNRVVKPCGRKPLRAGKQSPISRAFLLPPVLYCNLEIGVCQVLKIISPHHKYLGAINKEKDRREIACVHTNALKKGVFCDIIL